MSPPTRLSNIFPKNVSGNGFFLSLPMKSKPFGFFHRQLEPVFTVGPSENSVLILEPVENRQSESSRPIFRTLRRNLEGCARTPKISIRTESAASWATRAKEKPTNPCDFLPRNEKRPAVDLSMPGVNCLGSQSSNFLTKAHWSLTTLVTESTLSGESSRQVGGDLWGSLGISGSRIAKRDFIRTTPAARIPAISDRCAGADKEEGEPSRATRTSMDLAAIVGDLATDVRSHISRVYL